MSGREPNLLRWEVSGVDSGPQPQPKKGIEMGGRTLAGTQPSFLIWYMHEWTGLRPYLGISGGLSLIAALLFSLRIASTFEVRIFPRWITFPPDSCPLEFSKLPPTTGTASRSYWLAPCVIDSDSTTVPKAHESSLD